MTPAGTVRLVAPVAAMRPSARPEEITAQAGHLLLADPDTTDAGTAVIRLGRQRHHIAADILAEVRAVRRERLARAPLPLTDTDPGDPRRYRAEFLAIVNAIASRTDQAPVTPADPPPVSPTRSTTSARSTTRASASFACLAPAARTASGGPRVVPGSASR